MRGGWIVLDRKILSWEWYDDPNTLRLFIHLLLTVNWKDGKWHGTTIVRGERISSYRKIAKELDLNEKTIRKSAGKLCSTGEIEVESCHNWTRFRVCNFNKYQDMLEHPMVHGMVHPMVHGMVQGMVQGMETIEQGNNNKQSLLTMEQRDGLAPGAPRKKEYQDRLEAMRKKRDEGIRKWTVKK